MRRPKPDESPGALFPPPKLKPWQRPRLTGEQIAAGMEAADQARARSGPRAPLPPPPAVSPVVRKRGEVARWKARALAELGVAARAFPDLTVDDVWFRLPAALLWQRRAMAEVMRSGESHGLIARTSKTRLAKDRPGFANNRLAVWVSLVYR